MYAFGQVVGVEVFSQVAILFVADDITLSAVPERHRHTPTCHTLYQCLPKSLIERRRHHHIGSIQHLCNPSLRNRSQVCVWHRNLFQERLPITLDTAKNHQMDT